LSLIKVFGEFQLIAYGVTQPLPATNLTLSAYTTTLLIPQLNFVLQNSCSRLANLRLSKAVLEDVANKGFGADQVLPLNFIAILINTRNVTTVVLEMSSVKALRCAEMARIFSG